MQRVSIWFSFNGFGQIFGSLVAYGIGKAAESVTFGPWRILFLVNGLLTVALGIVFCFIVPDNQMSARWLDSTDRLLAIERIRINQQGIGNKHFKWYQFREAFSDPMTWALFFYALIGDIPNGGISNFFNQLVRIQTRAYHSTCSTCSFFRRLLHLAIPPNKASFTALLAAQFR